MRLFLVGIGILITAAISLLVYTATIPSFSVPAVTSTGIKVPAREVPPGYREYRHNFYRFSLLYPESLTVTEHPEPVTKLTLVFEGPEHSFQLHILPYGDEQITERRFALDIPSGEFNDPVDVVIDGVHGTMFESSDAAIGETREVWFIAHGFLYEVTAAIAHDAWLSEIMRSWVFTK